MKNLFSKLAAIPALIAFTLMMIALFNNSPSSLLSCFTALFCALSSAFYLIAWRNNDETTNGWLNFGDKQYLVLSFIWCFNMILWITMI
jgi:hypothetical protein